mgnify:CR=1 FL=1
MSASASTKVRRLNQGKPTTPERFDLARRALFQWDNRYFGEYAFSGDPRKQIQVVHLALSVVEYTPDEEAEYTTWLNIGEEPDGARRLVELGLKAPRLNQKRVKELRAKCDPAVFVMDRLDRMSKGFPNFLRNPYAIENGLVTRTLILSGVHRPQKLEQPTAPVQPLLVS